MIYLDSNQKSLMIVLAGAVSANQMDISSHFFDLTPQVTTTERRGGVQSAASNNTTDATIVSAPAQQGIVRNIHTLFINNRDTATATVTVKLDDNGTQKVLVKQAIAAGESLVYEDKAGWNVLSPITPPFVDTTNIIKNVTDTTKQLRISAALISTATTRVWTAPDADITVGGSSGTLTTGRVVYTTTGGLLTADGNLLYDGTTLTVSKAMTITPANASVTVSPTGTGTVTINPATLGNIDNTRIGFSTRAAIQATSGDFSTTLLVTGHTTFEGVTSTGATGTGNLVYSATQTLTGTLTAAIANFSGAVATGALTVTGAASTTTTMTVGTNLTVSGTGPHAIGGATDTRAQIQITGSFTGSSDVYGINQGSTLIPAANGLGLGVILSPTINKAGSGTHADFASLYLNAPTIGAGAATLTNATTLKIAGDPSVGTNKRGLWNVGTTWLDGATTLGALLDISGASAGQIAFPATQNASAGANTLDDYEEGTWTISLGGTATYTTRSGVYTKVGNLVYIAARMTVNAIGTGSTTQISGLPFTVAANNSSGIALAALTSSATAVVSAYPRADANATTLTIGSATAAAANLTGSFSIFQNGTLLDSSGCYSV